MIDQYLINTFWPIVKKMDLEDVIQNYAEIMFKLDEVLSEQDMQQIFT